MLSNGVKGQEDIVINQVSSSKTSDPYTFLYRINFHGYSREAKFPQNSEVLKLLREQEAAIARPGVEGMSALQENRNYNSNDVFLGTSFLSIFLILSPSTKNQIQSRTHVSLNPVIWLDGRQSFCIARKSKYRGSCSSVRLSHQSTKQFVL